MMFMPVFRIRSDLFQKSVLERSGFMYLAVSTRHLLWFFDFLRI
jgi:hypothetical protein